MPQGADAAEGNQRTKPGRWLPNLLTLGLGFILCLGLGEGFARIYFSRSFHSGRDPVLLGTIGEYDSLLGVRLLPNARAEFSGPEFRTVIQTNSHRLRESEEISYAAARGERRILICGDSFTFGHGVDEKDRYGERLEALLDRVSVVNMGVWGTGTDQQYLLYRDEGTKYSADLVILAYFVENIVRNGASVRFMPGGRSAYKPRFVLQEGRLVLTNVPVPEAGKAGAQEAVERERWREIEKRQGSGVPIPFKAYLREHSSLYKLVHSHLSESLHRALGRTTVVYPEYAKGRTEWEVTRALFRAFAAEARSHGSEFLLVVVPDGRSLASGQLDEQPYRMIDQSCTEDSIPVLDLLPGFKEAGRNGRRDLYYRYDPHWTAAGHALAAELIAARLRAHGW